MGAGARRWPNELADLCLLLGFFVSGCSALIYQVGWQRSLFTHIGVDIDSITIIVSMFMLGIGTGGMLGGWLADALPRQRLRCYAAIELLIGCYGLASLWLLPRLVAQFPPTGAGAAAASLAFLFTPTVLMGMTLPLLTMAFDQHRGNVGVSVGTLYFANTLGAAAGAALVPFQLLPQWPLTVVIQIAVAGNLAVMLFTLLAVVLNRPGRDAASRGTP